ncbi:hypothetical protein [Psychrobacillus sp. MER TA 171]|uniref:hypothetical protein n=1 Tax=Psychrobacillus sp. MER TA 171 TaxID=2939577 RepID=UPI00203AD854|nr:hypothetical protein [Psychrobacillus sp. MER TA 171]MCM3359208.1 hypothetical protein [Psychrobacillus sp. MER TA 171]
MKILMIKKSGNKTLFWNISEYLFRGPITIVSGTLGIQGKGEEQKLRFWENRKKFMKSLADEKANQGYQLVEEKDLKKVYIQYRYNEENEEEFEMTEDKSLMVEEIVEEELMYTGNGYAYGSEIGAGAGTSTFQVLDIEIAFNSIWKLLSEKKLTEGVEIAFETDEGSYVSLYPKGAVFELV